MSSTSRNTITSYLPSEPADPADDLDLIGGTLIGRVKRVVGNDPHTRRVRVRNVLQPLGDEAHSVEQHEDPRWSGESACKIDEDHVAVVKGRHHTVPFDMHDPEIGGIGTQAVRDPRAPEVVRL